MIGRESCFGFNFCHGHQNHPKCNQALIGFSRFKIYFCWKDMFPMAKKPHEVNLCVLERFFHRCFEILLCLFHIPISSHTSMPTAFAASFKRLKTTFCPLHREGCWTAVPQRAKPASICAPARPLLRASLTKACGSGLLLTQDFRALVPAQPAQLIVGWLDQLLPLQHDLAHQAMNLDLNRKKRTRRCSSWTSHCCHPTLRSARHPSKSLQLRLSSLPIAGKPAKQKQETTQH